MRIAIIGGGPGGYEAALVAAELGAEVTVVDRSGLGGACVLWDCVPSKTLCSTVEVVTWMEQAPSLGLTTEQPALHIDLPTVFQRIVWLANAQSQDVEKKVAQAGVKIVHGTGRLDGPHEIAVDNGERIEADAILVATGSSPRALGSAPTDGKRILDARQVYDLKSVPERLIVIGSGATGAEFAHAFNRLGSAVTLVCSRDRVLPGEDADAARVLEEVFERRDMTIMKQARAASARVTSDGVEVELVDGRVVEGTHALVTVGQVPNSADLGLENAGVKIVRGTGRLDGPHEIAVDNGERIEADAILIATGSSPRALGSAPTDGTRILNARQVYDLDADAIRVCELVRGAQAFVHHHPICHDRDIGSLTMRARFAERLEQVSRRKLFTQRRQPVQLLVLEE